MAPEDATTTALLVERWGATARATGLVDGAPALGADLLKRWAQPHRRYHDLRHLAGVLHAVDTLAAVAGDVEAVRLAAWFHDAVYEGRPGFDEEASAGLAQRCLTAAGLAPARVAEVARLVRLTAGHRPDPGDADGEVLCDADLAVLGWGSRRYDRYAADVRAEYAHLPDQAFRAGRTQVLRALAARPRLFRTARAHELWEDAARANLARELAALTPAATRPGAGRA